MGIEQMEELYIWKQRHLFGKSSKEQRKFIAAMQASNALAGFAHSVEEAIDIVFPKE